MRLYYGWPTVFFAMDGFRREATLFHVPLAMPTETNLERLNVKSHHHSNL